MTFNFGHKVFLGFVAFAAMMSFLVYKCMQTKYDLVSKDYYKDELQYQQVIDGAARAGQLSKPVTMQVTDSGIVVQYPAEMQEANNSGDLLFYCADDARKDRKLAVQPGEKARQTISRSAILPGNYTVKISWQFNGHDYYTELYTVIF